MMGKMKQMQQAQQMLNNPRESPQIRAVADIIASLERDQRAAVQALAETVDGADVPADLPDRDQRMNELCDALPVLLSGGGPFALYVDHVAPEEFDPEQAAQYVGMDRAAWEAQCDRWAAAYRERVDGDEFDDRDLVDVHCRNTFGMGVDRFEAEVVRFEPGRVLQQFVAGPIEEHTATVDTLADALGDV